MPTNHRNFRCRRRCCSSISSRCPARAIWIVFSPTIIRDREFFRREPSVHASSWELKKERIKWKGNLYPHISLLADDSSIERPPRGNCSTWLTQMNVQMEVWRKAEISSSSSSKRCWSSSVIHSDRRRSSSAPRARARRGVVLLNEKLIVKRSNSFFPIAKTIDQQERRETSFSSRGENDRFAMTSSLNLSNEAWNFVMNHRIDIDRWEDIHSLSFSCCSDYEIERGIRSIDLWTMEISIEY